MSKNALSVPGKKQKFVDITSILNNPAQRTRLQNYIDEVIRCKTKILDENESIRTLRESAVEELGIEPKMFNSLTSVYFNNNFEQKRDELEKLTLAIESLMRISQ